MVRRVLHIGKFFPPHRGGMETFLADLVAEQRAQGMEACAVVHGDPRLDDPPWLVRVPVQVHIVYAPIAFGFRKALVRAIARFEPEVLHLHLPNNSALWLLTMAAARDIPWIVHWQSDIVASRIRPALRLAYLAYKPFERAVLSRADCVVATSPAYLAFSPPLQPWLDKCVVLPLGLGGIPYAPDSGAGDHPGTEDGVLRILSVGRLAYYKGFETLVEAVSRMDKVELLIAGEGELRASLEALILARTRPGRRPAVRLLGGVSNADKATLLRNCDVFCLASRERTESFGMVLLEAMAFAKPCIVSELPGSGMPWLVGEAGCGICVPPEDVAAWTQAIDALRSDPAKRVQLGARGLQAVQTRFSISACVRTLRLLYGRSTAPAAPEAYGQDQVLIVIPARNEAATVGSLVTSIKAAGWPHVLVVDDQSTDGTATAAADGGARVLSPVLPVGAWGGMQSGLRYAMARGFSAAVTMDADGQHEVAQLPSLFAERGAAELVIGAFPERASRARQWAWRWFRQLAGFELRDLTSGFRLYSRSAMAILASDDASLLDYQDLGALLMVRRAGLRIVEVPVTMNLRTMGKSKVFDSWFAVARYMAVTTLLCLARWQTRRRRSA